MTSRTRAERRYELAIIAVAAVAVCFRTFQWHTGWPDLNPVAVVALLLVPLAVRAQFTISRGQTDLTLGASAAILFAAEVDRAASILPLWAVLVAGSYAVFYRDETWGMFRASVQVLGGAALLRVAQVTDVGFRPYDRVFTGLATYFVVISALEIGRRRFAERTDDGWALRLRWTWTFLIGLTVFYIGCVFAALRRIQAGIELPIVPSFVVAVLGMTAVLVGLTMRNVELNRSVEALSGAAVSMPWRRADIDATLRTWGAKGLRVENVVVQSGPGSRWDFSVPLNDGRYVVAERSSGDLPFTQVERHVLEALGNMSDSSRREAAHRAELRDRANTDGLTGLPTYTYFRELLADISRTRRPGESIAVVFIDLDNFKEINDRFGHIVGDAAIRTVAERLLAHTGDPLVLTRYGGDEFAVVIRDVPDYAALTVECEKLTTLVAEPVLSGRDTVRLRASIGSALSTSPDDDLEAVVRAADQQMYQRKRAIHAGDGEVTSRIDEAVRRAIVDRTLWTAFQPIIALRDDLIRGFEVLVRCTDPQLGSIPPPVIVESATRLNLLDDMTGVVLDQTVATLGACRAYVPDLVAFSINLELEQMTTWTPLLERIVACRAEHGLRVTVEISERSIGDWSDANAKVAARLRDADVLIAIDDFGSGAAGLGSLYLPRVDVVKLDRSLMTDLSDPRQTLVVTRATQLLLELGFWVVAEGITALHEVPILRDAGATHIQGFLYGMPEGAAATIERVRQHGLEAVVWETV